MHDHAVSLGAQCGEPDADDSGKSVDIEPAEDLAIKAGDNVVPVTDDDLVALKSMVLDLGPEALVRARERLGLT